MGATALAVTYIVVVSALFVLACQYAPEPRPMEHTDPLIGFFVLGCYLTGAMIGYYLPDLIAQALGLAWSKDGLAFGAKVFGAVGGFLIAARSIVLWPILFLLGLVVSVPYALLSLWLHP